MKNKSFQKSYAKLYLVTEDVYDRIMKQIEDQSEQEEMNNLNAYNNENVDEENMLPIEQEIDNTITEKSTTSQSQDNDNTENGSNIQKENRIENTPEDDFRQENTNSKKTECVQNNNVKEIWKKFVCSFCQKGYSTRGTLNRHITIVHCSKEVLPSSPVKTSEQKVDREDLSSNVQKYDKPNVIVKKQIATDKKSWKPKRFECNVCSKTFTSQFSKNRHISNTHFKKIQNESVLPTQTQETPNLNNARGIKRMHGENANEIMKKMSRKQGVKRSSNDQADETVASKRNKLEQGIKRKKEDEFFAKKKRVKFADWF